MKKLILLLFSIIFGVSLYAGVPYVESNTTTDGIKIVNDSTIIYYDTYKILVKQPENVYTAIFKLPSYLEMKKGKLPVLMMMSFGSYCFIAPDDHSNYILYASKSFDKILYRQTEYKSYY